MARAFEGIIAIEGQPTGDGRMIERGAVTWGEGPWPVKWYRIEGDHAGEVIGEVTRVWRDGDRIRGEGVFHDDSSDARTATEVRRVLELLESDEGASSVGVSIGLDAWTTEIRVKKEIFEEWQAEIEAWLNDEVPEPDDPQEDSDGRIILERFAHDDFLSVDVSGRFRELSVVHVAAFPDAKVAPGASADEQAIAASIRLTESIGLVASLSIDQRSRAFANPNFGDSGDVDPRLVWQVPERPDEVGQWGCPLTITDDGQVYGHATLRNRCHGSFATCLPAPDSGGDFSRFLIGEAVPGVPTGPVVLDTTHGVDDQGKVKSSDWLADTGRAVADVTVGHDRHGLWVAGRLRPGISEKDLATLRGSALSGEWHPHGGKLRLVGILAVNGPGYLVQRRGVAASFTMGATCCGEERSFEDRFSALEGAVADLLKRGV